MYNDQDLIALLQDPKTRREGFDKAVRQIKTEAW